MAYSWMADLAAVWPESSDTANVLLTIAKSIWDAKEDALAGRSRGTLFRVAANPEYAFERVRNEISSHYMLGVEPVERDRDGRAHQIRVEVRRKGVEVRARRQVKYALRTPNTWSRFAGSRALRVSASHSS